MGSVIVRRETMIIWSDGKPFLVFKRIKKIAHSFIIRSEMSLRIQIDGAVDWILFSQGVDQMRITPKPTALISFAAFGEKNPKEIVFQRHHSGDPSFGTILIAPSGKENVTVDQITD